MPLSVILVSDVPGLGQLGDTCKVKDGFARNYLLPQKLAVPATPNMVKRFERQKEKLAAARDKELSQSKSLADKISKVGLVFDRPMGQGGRLFGSVTPLDIAQEIGRQGIPVEKKSILMSGPIKTAGDHQVRVRVHSQVVVDVPIKVVAREVNRVSEHAEHADALNETPLQPAPDDY